MSKHYEEIAKIIGGTLHTSNRLQVLVKTLSEYFDSQDEDFDIEKFKSDALNGNYIDDTIETPIIQKEVNIWEPKPMQTTVSSTAQKINVDFEKAMARMSTIVGRSYGSNKTKKG